MASRMAKTGAECLVARARPSVTEVAIRSGVNQSQKARLARTTAVAQSKEIGRSVSTRGRCAATAGSMTRTVKTASAGAGPNTRRSANVKMARRKPFSIHMAMRARRCTESGSLCT